MPRNTIKQVVPAFLTGAAILFIIYFLILTWVTGDWRHPFQQFLEYWYWLIPMEIGFGIQAAMFWYLKKGLHLRTGDANVASGVGLGTSSAAMAACCAHHIVELLPFLGLSAISLWFSKYQNFFFATGILFNIFGILYMYRVMKKHYLYK